MLATAAGCLSSMLYMWVVFGKPDPTMGCNGLLAGAVAITAPCAFVNPIGAVIIGAIAGVLVIWSVLFVERVLKVDDPVGAVSVHGVCGAFGCLCIGLFADGEYGAGWNGVADKTPLGLFYGGGVEPARSPRRSASLANILWVFPVAFLSFMIIEKTDRQPRLAPRTRSTASTSPRWASSATSTRTRSSSGMPARSTSRPTARAFLPRAP